MRAVCLFPILVLVAAGCASKSKTKADAEAAFVAGQQQAWTQIQQMRPNSVRVIGPVHQPLIEWTEKLTLAEAIVAAGYQGPDPRIIVVRRNGQPIAVDPQRLLSGDDMPLERGDVVEILP